MFHLVVLIALILLHSVAATLHLKYFELSSFSTFLVM